MKRIIAYSRAWRSGSGLYAQGLVEGLAEAGHPVTFIAPAGYPEDRTARFANVRRVRPPRELPAGGSRAQRILRQLARVLGGLSALVLSRFTSDRFVVSIPDPFAFSLWPLILLRLTRAQIIFVCHDPRPHSWTLPERARSLERAGYRLMYRTASRVVVLSEAGKAALANEFDIPGQKISVLPHGAFDVPYAGSVPGSGILLAFGTIRRNKQVHLAIEAVLAARQAGVAVRLVVAGAQDPNDAAYLDECMAIAAQCPDGIAMEVGFIPEERMMALFAESDALIMPYRDFDSQSGVAVVAGMAGRPVIVAAEGGIPDLISAGLPAMEIRNPVDLSSVSTAIASFYMISPADWTDRSIRGRALLSETLAWPQTGRRLAELFD